MGFLTTDDVDEPLSGHLLEIIQRGKVFLSNSWKIKPGKGEKMGEVVSRMARD